jgi:hypothetical protein
VALSGAAESDAQVLESWFADAPAQIDLESFAKSQLVGDADDRAALQALLEVQAFAQLQQLPRHAQIDAMRVFDTVVACDSVSDAHALLGRSLREQHARGAHFVVALAPPIEPSCFAPLEVDESRLGTARALLRWDARPFVGVGASRSRTTWLDALNCALATSPTGDNAARQLAA